MTIPMKLHWTPNDPSTTGDMHTRLVSGPCCENCKGSGAKVVHMVDGETYLGRKVYFCPECGGWGRKAG